jgi:hypothetical protein
MPDALLLNTLTFAAALAAALRLRIRPLRLFPLAVLLLHVLFVQAWVLSTGLAGLLSIQAWRIIEAVLAAVLVCHALGSTWACREGPKTMLTPSREHGTQVITEWRRVRRRLSRTAAALRPWRCLVGGAFLLAMLAVLLVSGALVGPWLADVTHYHLVPPTDWVSEGRIASHDWADGRAWWPQGHGLLAAWWMTPTRSLHLAIWAELHWVLLAWAAIWAWARQIGGSVRDAWLAVALSTAVPILWAQATSGLNDLAVAALLLAALAPLLRPRCSAANLALSAVALLIALGVKSTFIPLAPPTVVLLIFRAVKLKSPRRQQLARWITLLLLALLLGGFWYARNAVAWHNPLYPSGLRLGSFHPLAGQPIIEQNAGHVSLAQLKMNLADLLWEKMWDRHDFVSGQTENGAGFGAPAAALGLAAAVGLAFLRPTARPAIAVLLATTLLLCACVHPDIFIGRFFMFLPLAAVVFIALISPRIAPGIPRALWAMMLAAAVTVAWADGLYHAAPAWVWHSGIGGLKPKDALPTQDAATLGAAAAVPAGEPLVLLGSQAFAPALLHGPHLERVLIHHPGPVDALDVEAWRSRGVRWLMTDPPGSDRVPTEKWLTTAGLIRRGERVYEIP